MTPIVNGLELEFGGEIAFQRLNVDEPEGRLAARSYEVRGHPTVVLLNPQGQTVSTHLGAVPREDLIKAIEKLLE